MTPRWHSLIFPCPRCTVNVTLIDIKVAADKEVVAEGFCKVCEQTWLYKTDMTRILAFCRAADTWTAQHTNTPLRPPEDSEWSRFAIGLGIE